jgi:transposase
MVIYVYRVELTTLLLSIGSLVAATVALFIAWFQLKHHRIALGVQILVKYEERFDDSRMRAKRAAAAKALLARTDSPELEAVLDFFETIGLLVRKRCIQPDIAASSFAFWALRYWQLAQNRVMARREAEHDSTIWEYAEKLVERFNRIESHSGAPTTFSEEQLANFLQGELGP